MYQDILEDPFLADVSISILMKPIIFAVPNLDVTLREAGLKFGESVSNASNATTSRRSEKGGPVVIKNLHPKIADLDGKHMTSNL